MQITRYLRAVFARNKLLIAVVAMVFFAVIFVSALATYAILLTFPNLVQSVQGIISTSRSYAAIPRPYTKALYLMIFLNNIGHFWNPSRIWVWVPFAGAFSLGYELLLNAVVIGAIATFATFTKGAMYTVAGLTPHGVFEIPAFILEFAGLARWHVVTTRSLYEKLSGRGVDRPLLIEGIKDALTLSLISVALFAIAAYVESFVTPRFLGL